MSKKKRKINDSPPFGYGAFSGESIPFRFDRIGARFNERNESSIALLIQSRTEFARAREAGTRADINLSVPQNDSQHDFRRSERGEREGGEGNPPGNACHVAAQRVRVKFERGILATPPTYFITLSTSSGVQPAILEIVEEEDLPDLDRQRPFSHRQIRGNNVGRSGVTGGSGNESISSPILFSSLYFSESVYPTPWIGGGWKSKIRPKKGR